MGFRLLICLIKWMDSHKNHSCVNDNLRKVTVTIKINEISIQYAAELLLYLTLLIWFIVR